MCRLFLTVLVISATFSIDLRSPFDEKLHDTAEELILTGFGSAVTIILVVSLIDETNRNQRDLRCDVVFIGNVVSITPRQRLPNVIFIEDYQLFIRFSFRFSSINSSSYGNFLLFFVREKRNR